MGKVKDQDLHIKHLRYIRKRDGVTLEEAVRTTWGGEIPIRWDEESRRVPKRVRKEQMRKMFELKLWKEARNE